MPGQLLYWVSGQRALLEYITDDAIAQLYVTKFSTISHYFTKLFVKQSFAIASSVTYGEIRQNFSYSHTRQTKQNGVPHVFFSCLGWSEQTCPLFTICLGGLGPCLPRNLAACQSPTPPSPPTQFKDIFIFIFFLWPFHAFCPRQKCLL